MRSKPLMVVEESFQLTDDRVVLIPDFSVPPGRWKNVSEEVEVVRPGGEKVIVHAEFNQTHFNIPDPKSTIDQRWRITVWITGIQKIDIPNGSEVFTSQETYDAITKGN